MDFIRIRDYLWEIPRLGAMLVPGRVYASAHMMEELRDDPALTQVANVACLPGIVGYSLAMPDIHWGYGFPIGGVAAIDPQYGVVSPGGVGYDISCGVRLDTDQFAVPRYYRKGGASSRRAFRCHLGRRWLSRRHPWAFDRGIATTSGRRRALGAPPRICNPR
jgi:hypothetical protein